MDRKKQVLISVTDKSDLLPFARELLRLNFNIIASGGTATFLQNGGIPVERVSDLTKSPEILGGRVKTLHPAIFGGILSRDTPSDLNDLQTNNYKPIDMVVCNLYAFSSVIQKDSTSLAEAIENIDIGGVSLLRAAAKNHDRTVIICDTKDYDKVIKELNQSVINEVSLQTRRELALKAFTCTAEYDTLICDHFRKQFKPNVQQINLKYGINPHQKPAQIFHIAGNMPLKVLNGSPSYINLCDGLNAWQLVRELRQTLNLPAAASFKHTSPAGAAVYSELFEKEQFYLKTDTNVELTSLAIAYLKARNADPMSSFGDFIALSDVCDIATAKMISREVPVSDGIIAPGYEEEALKILQKKKNGGYCILKIDSQYEPTPMERRVLFGLTLEQKRNNALVTKDLLKNIVTENKEIPSGAQIDLLLSTVTVKYTQSNSVCYAKSGQVIGVGAGQQSRIHCTRLAGEKVNNWWLRQHPNVRNMKFRKGMKRTDMVNAIDFYVTSDPATATANEFEQWQAQFEELPPPLTLEDRRTWISRLSDVSLSSDAFFPFRDNVDRAKQSGVKYILSPAGSINDEQVIEACNDHNIVLVHTNLRLFHH